MKKLTFLLLLVAICSGNTSLLASELLGTAAPAKKSFSETFPGKPILTIFADYKHGFDNVADQSKFEIKRAYIGYKFDNNSNWSGSIIFDIAAADVVGKNLEFTSHLKNASVAWSKDNLKINFGVIKTNNYATQEKAWGHRYIMKTFSNEYGLAPSADLGVSASYKFSSWLKADVSVTNGKGNKKLNVDGNFRYGTGFTFNLIDNVTFRAYYDLYAKDEYGTDNANQQTVSLFAEYKHSKFSVAGDYGHMFNSDFNKGDNLYGFSLYSTVKIVDKLDAFARYDNFNANTDSNDDTGSALRAGVEYSPLKFLKISPNIYNWNPTSSQAETFIYLNILINF